MSSKRRTSGEDNLPLSTEDKQRKASEDERLFIEKAAECPVCYEIAAPPIKLCKTGHFVCAVCRTKLDRCGICREAFTEGRNWALESLVAKLKTHCRYEFCEEYLTLDNLVQHMDKCDYRPISCRFHDLKKHATSCKDKINYGEYENHLIKCHEATRSSTISLSEFHIQKSVEDRVKAGRSVSAPWAEVIYLHDGATFILNICMDKSDVQLWVSAMLPRVETEKYVADLRIGQCSGGKINTNATSVEWKTLEVVSVHRTLEEARKFCDYVSISANYVIQKLAAVSREDEDDDPTSTFSVGLTLRLKEPSELPCSSEASKQK